MSLAAASAAGESAYFAAVSAYGSSDSGRRAHSVGLVSRVDDRACHRPALTAQSDESDPHHLASIVKSFRRIMQSSAKSSAFRW